MTPRALLVALLAVALVLGPSLGPGRLVGDEGLDVWSHVWGLGEVARALGEGRLPWRPPGIAWPDGGVLWYIDPLGALVALLPVWLVGPELGYTAQLAVQVGLAAAAGFAYGRALGGSGWVAGLGLATTPFLLGELHNGIAEACWLGLVAASGAAAVQRSPWTGLWVGLAWVGTPYHGLSAALLASTHLLTDPDAPPPRARAGALLRMLALAALVAAPATLALNLALADPAALTQKPPPGDNWPVFRINAIDPLALIRPGDFWTVDLQGPLEAPFRRTSYLGLGLLALGSLRLGRDKKRRNLLVPILVGVVLSLGPYLWWRGDWARLPDGRLVALPFRALLAVAGVSMDHPLRFIGGALVGLAGLADGAISGRRRPWLAPTLAAVVVVEQLLLAPSPWPLATAPSGLPEVYGALPADGRAVIDLPADRGDSIATNRYLYWQGLHGRPIPYAAKVGSQGFPSLNPALRTWTAAGRLTPVPESAPGAPQPGSDLSAAVAELAAQGFGWVVLHPELLAKPELLAAHREVLDPWLGAPREIEGRLVWEIPALSAPSGS